MEKIKINMVSGASLDKPLVTAFNGSNGVFVVLDNEMNGTMGLPIILVSKLENNKLTLIQDAEWPVVKETLRLIIAGNQVDYVKVNNELNADDLFFKQLTLPVESFETLKNSYKPVDDSANVVPEPTPINMVNPTSPVGPMPEVAQLEQQQINIEAAPAVNNAVNMEIPEPVNQMQTEPVMPAASVQNQEVAQVVPEVKETPVVEPIPEVAEQTTPVDFTLEKEAFLKACENMFDALVAKFKN